jgi:hypothetical protein
MMTALGNLKNLDRLIEASELSADAKKAFHNILAIMAEIDRNIIHSDYEFDRADGSNGRPPNGDDYNELWAAIQNEMVLSMTEAD